METSAATREQLAARQRAWMQQRQAENDRKHAQASLGLPVGGSSGGGAASASAAGGGELAGAANVEVLDRLAEQIAERLQVEVRKENAKLMQDGAVGAQVESLLEKHIGTNTCPICFELMTGKLRQPTLLFPCGHTFCADCLRQHLDKLNRKTCPYCREKVASQAPNISLQQVIDGFVERQQTLARGEVLPELEQSLDAAAQQQQGRRRQSGGGGGGGGSGGGTFGLDSGGSGGSEGDEANRYAEQYRTYTMRCRVMRNQLLDSHAESDALREKRGTAETVLAHLSNEEEAAYERLEAARLELEVIQAQRAEQAGKCEQLASRQHEIEQMGELVGQTHAGLEADRAKALLLVRNFAPALADSLQREMADER